MKSIKRISEIALSAIFGVLSVVHLVLIILSLVLVNSAPLLRTILWIIEGVSLLFVAGEVYYIIKNKKELNSKNIFIFVLYILQVLLFIILQYKLVELVFDYTIGLILKGIFKLIELIFPSSFTLVVTRFGEQFYQGIKYTLSISLIGTIIGFLIACVFGTIRSIKVNPKDPLGKKIVKRVVDTIIRVYVTVFRGTPMMVQAMIIYYGLVGVFKWTPVQAGLVIVSINTGAYLTEVIRDGIESIDKGQMEASRSLGFSYFESMVSIVFPQAIKNSMASIGNEFVINIKDTSVLNVIGCAEMYFILNTSAATNYKYMEQMIVGAIIYLILTLSTTKILKAIEKKLDVPSKELKGSN